MPKHTALRTFFIIFNVKHICFSLWVIHHILSNHLHYPAVGNAFQAPRVKLTNATSNRIGEYDYDNSTAKQKTDLKNQIETLKQFCFMNGYQISGIFSDIASGIDFEKRKNFFKMLDEIIEGKVEKVIITYKDRLSRVGFGRFKYLFEHYHCQIIVMSDIGSEKLDSEEIFEEVVSLLHCYSMKLYSSRRVQKIKEALSDDIGNANRTACDKTN